MGDTPSVLNRSVTCVDHEQMIKFCTYLWKITYQSQITQNISTLEKLVENESKWGKFVTQQKNKERNLQKNNKLKVKKLSNFEILT